LIYAPKTYKYVFLSITLLSILLALGKNLAWFNYAIFDFLPGYNKFRAVTMALSIALFAIPVLGSLGLEYLFRSGDNKSLIKNLSIALGSTAGLALVFMLFAGMFGFRAPVDANLPEWLVDAIQEDRKSMLQSSAMKSVIFILLAAALIWAGLKNKISAQVAGLGIAVLVAVDLWTINKRYLNEESFQSSPSAQFFAKSPADEKILKDESYFRIISLEDPFNNARPSYFFNSIGGYHGAKMKRYQELTENVLGPEIQSFIQKAQEGNFDWQGLKALNMLNTKYVVAGPAENAVFTNPEANGPAWFPSNIRSVTSNEDEIKLISQIDTKNEATVNETEFGTVQTGSGSVAITSQKPNELKYSVEATKAGLVVFSEIYYPKGWKALVNGQEADIIRTNYLLRGISVPAGKSEVLMKFEPDSYYKTKNVTVIFQYLILVTMIAGIFLSVRPFPKP
jgi:hypothetical protein